MNPKETEALVSRLERLERDNRYLRWIGSALFLGLAGLIVLGPGALMSRSRLQAERLELKDRQGRVRASLGFDDDGAPSLRFQDEEGRDQIAMIAHEQSTTFDLYQQGRPRMSMLTTIDGASSLQFLSPKNNIPSSFYMWPEGTSGLFLSGEGTPVHLATSATPNGPAKLSLLDRNFREAGSFQLTPDGGLDWQAAATSSMVTSELYTTIENTVANDQPSFD